MIVGREIEREGNKEIRESVIHILSSYISVAPKRNSAYIYTYVGTKSQNTAKINGLLTVTNVEQTLVERN